MSQGGWLYSSLQGWTFFRSTRIARGANNGPGRLQPPPRLLLLLLTVGDIPEMDSVNGERKIGCHVVAMPYPGRGHINPMMNLCKLLSSRSDDILITVVVTEEWLSLIGSESKPANIRFVSIPNVVPSELVRAADLLGFLDAVWTKMEAPFERLLDRLEPPVTVIIADTLLSWAVGVGNRRNIPVASLWPMSATVFSIIYYLGVLAQNRTLPVDLSGAFCVLALYRT